jgi:methylaspartate ammonia-lyase
LARWGESIDDLIPDARDGLTRTERIILYLLKQTREELGGRNVPTVMLYGRVVEHVNITEQELHLLLNRLGVNGDGS